MRAPTILAMGGGGFTMGDPPPGLDRLVLDLTATALPRICFLPTASGDPFDQVTRFHERYADWPCVPSILSLFHLGRDRIDPVRHLLAQDAIYVGGGSMRNMLAIWREHGIDQAMRSAWRRGIVLAGLSAGAMCWFQGGISMSGGSPEPVQGLGLLAGSLSVHMDGEPERIGAYRSAVTHGRLPPGWAVDDGAALLFRGQQLVESVAARPGARVLRVEAGDAGTVRQTRVGVRSLAPPSSAVERSEVPFAVAELRALRAGPRRWD
jgi:peptidase E